MRWLLRALTAGLFASQAAVQAIPLTTDVSRTSVVVETNNDNVNLHILRTDDLFDDAQFMLERMTHVLLKVHVGEDSIKVNDEHIMSHELVRHSTRLVKTETVLVPRDAVLTQDTLAALPRGIVSARVTIEPVRGRCGYRPRIEQLVRGVETRRYKLTAQIIEDDNEPTKRLTSIAVPVLEVVLRSRTRDGQLVTMRAYSIDRPTMTSRMLVSRFEMYRNRFRHFVRRVWLKVEQAPLLALAIVLKLSLLFGLFVAFVRRAAWPQEGAIQLDTTDSDSDTDSGMDKEPNEKA